MRNHLHAAYSERRNSRGGPVRPPRSPDPNPSDFFWCHLKSLAYATPVATVEDLTARIVVASADIDPSSVSVCCAMTYAQ
ncbi:hypothetical protein TNCV_3324621 [Trichonephila clavipes]|nr:hypothetical protein TNCV_3324621 [Trichonephila clavipes]